MKKIITKLFIIGILSFPVYLFAQAPVNDNCANPITLIVDAPCTNGTNVGATVQAGSEHVAANCWGSVANRTVWYTFTTGAAGAYKVSCNTGGGTNTQIKVWDRSCPTALPFTGCNENVTATNLAAEVTMAALLANTTYYIQVDVNQNAVGPFCIEVTTIQPIPNDCILNAIDLTPFVYGINSNTPFICKSYDYKNLNYKPTEDSVGSAAIPCFTNTIPPPLGTTPRYFDTWYKIVVTGPTAPNVWLDIFPQNGASTYTGVLYSGTPTGNCGEGNFISGLTYLDCSSGGLYVDVIGSKLGGSRDVTTCSALYPRLSLKDLTTGTYYLRVFEWAFRNDAALINQKTNICVESGVPVDKASDRCPVDAKLGKVCGTMPNQNVNEIHLNQSNAGTYGNGCKPPIEDEPIIAVANGDFKTECGNGDSIWYTNVDYVNNTINNTSLYSFDINACATCQAFLNIKLDNIRYGGVNGSLIQVQVMNAGYCRGSSNAIIAYSGNLPCVELEPTVGTPIPNGRYTLMIDGQNGQLIATDITLKITYDGTNCAASVKPVSKFTAADTICLNTATSIAFSGTVGGVQGDAPKAACPTPPTYLWSFDGGTGGATTTAGPHNVQWSTPGVKTVSCKLTVGGCESTFIKTIVVSPVIVQTITAPSPICVDNPFDLSISGTGTTPYTKYTWNFNGAQVNSGSGAGPYNLTFKTAGTKTITLTASNKGCTPVVISKDITVNASPIADFAIDNSSTCIYDSVTVTSLNTNAGNAYTWNFNGATTNPSTLTGPGPYKVIWSTAGTKSISLSITNAGCISLPVTKVVTVNDIPVLTLVKTDLSCFGTSDGTITASGTGGSGTFLYNINGGAYSSSANFTGKAKGKYTIGIKDVTTSCLGVTKDITIAEPAKIVVTASNQTNSTCGNSDGTITIGQSGGIGAMQYKIDGGTYQSAPVGGIFGGLAAGSHIGYAKDSKGCVGQVNFIIEDAGAIALVLDSKTDVTCPGGLDGQLKVKPAIAGGTYTYTISPISKPTNTDGIFTGLPAGTYTVSAVTNTNCKSTIGNLLITEPSEITADISGTNPLCIASNNGTASVSNVLGGTGTKTFEWNTNPVQTTAAATGLAAGTYTVTIKDANLCFITKSITLVDPQDLVLDKSVKDAHCGKSDGVITISATKGNGGPFTYSKDGGNNFQNSGVFNGLAANTYSIIARDKNNCSKSITATVEDLAGPTVSVSADYLEICQGGSSKLGVTTNGVEFVWSNPSDLDNPNSATPKASPTKTTTYTCTVKDAFGCENSASITIIVNPKDPVTFAYPTNEICADAGNIAPVLGQNVKGVFFASPSTGLIFVDEKTGEIDVKNSTPGTYNITFSSSEKCPNDSTITFKIKSLPIVDAGTDKNLCFGTSEFLGSSFVPGTTYSWSPNTDLDNASLAQPKVSSAYTGSTVLSRKYFVTVVNDACTSIDSVLVNFNPSPIAEAGAEKFVKCNGKVNLLATATGGTGVYKYKWQGGPATANYNNVGVGKYFVTVTDAKGCTHVDSVSVKPDPNTLTLKLSASNLTPCPGETYTLSTVPTNAVGTVTYTWNDQSLTGAGPHSIVSGTGKKKYIVSAKDANGCVSIDSVLITPQPLPVAAFTYKKTDQSLELFGSTLRNANKWEWDLGDRSAILNGQTVTYTYLTKGVYDVTLYLTNPCGIDTMFCKVNVNGTNTVGAFDTCGSFSTGIINVNKSNSLKLYPNPTEGNIILEMNNPEIESVRVYDMLGKMVYHNTFSIAVNRLMLDLGAEATGIYTVQVIGKSFNTSKKVQIISK